MSNWYEVEALMRNHQQEVAHWAAERRWVKLAARPLRERVGHWLVRMGEALLKLSHSASSAALQG